MIHLKLCCFKKTRFYLSTKPLKGSSVLTINENENEKTHTHSQSQLLVMP